MLMAFAIELCFHFDE